MAVATAKFLNTVSNQILRRSKTCPSSYRPRG